MSTKPVGTDTRTRELFETQHHRIIDRTNRLFAMLMGVQWIGGILLAGTVSPQTWRGSIPAVHIHVWSALFLGGLLSAGPIWMIRRHPRAVLTRHVVAVSQMLWSGLLIHLTGGRIETHFHVFGSLAFLAFYREWRVLIPATGIVAADHLLRGMFWPESVFGVLAASPWRAMEHAAWVVFEDIVLVLSCRQGTREMWSMASQQARLERTRDTIEQKVKERTSELEKANESLNRAKLEALASVRAKGEFLANMSHEIRTPMTAILGYSESLLDSTLPESEREDAVKTIHRNGYYLLDIINDILDLSKFEAGKMTVDHSPHLLQEIVTDVHDLIKVRSDAKGLPLIVKTANDLPTVIRTDATRLRQILINLLGNAVKFTNNGEVRLEIEYLADEDQPRVQFDVVDTGIGISEDQLPRLFQPFSQADNSTTRQFGGTGLGLVISKRLAEILGGDVVVAETAEGKGVRMRLTVACGSATENEAHADRLSRQSKTKPMAKPETTLDCRVLVAEDGPDNQRLIRHILNRSGANLTIVENGALAVKAATEAIEAGRSYDIILMDMQMPVMDGYAATEKLRAQGFDKPIVAITAHAMKGDSDKCILSGCDAYVSKPINRQELIATIKHYVQPALTEA